MAGSLLSALTAVIVSHGLPPAVPALFFISVGAVIGTVLGAFTGMVVARFETRGQAQASDDISIGVLCFDSEAETRATTALERAGAASINKLQ
jgi:hypothetical protein